jgi:hypothetical protein
MNRVIHYFARLIPNLLVKGFSTTADWDKELFIRQKSGALLKGEYSNWRESHDLLIFIFLT